MDAGNSNGETGSRTFLVFRSLTTLFGSGLRWARSCEGRELIGQVEGNFEELTLAVGARYQLGDQLVVEWSNDYGDGAIFRNVTIAEIKNGEAVSVTDYWGKPFETPSWRESMTDRLDMPSAGRWPSHDGLAHH